MANYKGEGQVLHEVGEWLQSKSFFFWRCNNIPAAGRKLGVYRTLPKYTPAGLPDFVVVLNGRTVGIECKRAASEDREPNGRKIRAGALSQDQINFAIALESAGGAYAVVHSSKEAEDFFNKL